MKQQLLSVAFAAGLALAPAAALGADPMPGDAASEPSAPPAQTKADLIGDDVIDSRGEQVGKVKDIRTNADGTATAVVIDTGSKDVAIPAGEIVIASVDTLRTAKSAQEVKKLPAEPKSSAPGSSTSPDMGGDTAP